MLSPEKGLRMPQKKLPQAKKQKQNKKKFNPPRAEQDRGWKTNHQNPVTEVVTNLQKRIPLNPSSGENNRGWNQKGMNPSSGGTGPRSKNKSSKTLWQRLSQIFKHLSSKNLSWIRTGVDKTSNLCDRSGHKSSKTLWQKSSQILQKPCDKSRRRTLKKYISVPKSAILKLKPNKDEVGHFEIEAKQRRVGHFEFTSNKEG